MEEMIDLFDDCKKNTGIVIPRSKEKELPEGKHILVSALIVMNSKKEIMLQLTSKERGNVYSLPSGHVLHGETSDNTIIREMYEEQGIRIDKKDICLVEERLANKIAFFDIYYINKDFERNSMKLQENEVEDVVWLKFDKIKLLYDEGKLRKSSYESINNFLNNYFIG